MRLLPSVPLRSAALPALRFATPRADILEELKYQVSNADPDSRPARDLVENPVAFAYLGVLALFGAGLAWLLYQDTLIAQKKEAALKEQEAAAEMLRAQGLMNEARALEGDLSAERAPPPAASGQGGVGEFFTTAAQKAGIPGYASAPIEDNPGNRFERRQGKAADAEEKKEKKAAKKKRRKGKGRRYS